MNVPVLGQHDGRWAGIRLGTQDGATIGGFGCLITDLTMANLAFGGGEGLVKEIDNIFTNSGGYVDGAGHRSPQMGCDMVDWGRIQALLPNLAHVGTGYYSNVPADLGRIKAWLDQGGLVVLEVRWKGNKNLMHFVLAIGYSGNDIIVNDPETGREQRFSSRLFGTGNSATDIVNAHFFADAIPAVQEQHPAPVPAPAAPPQITPPKEEEVTQAQHDADIAALKADYEARLVAAAGETKAAQDLVVKQSDTITKLTEQISAAIPEYEHTYQAGDRGEVLTDKHTVVVDFSDQHEPVELEANTIVEVEGVFTVGPQKYYRTAKSLDGGYYYGVSVADVTEYQSQSAAPVLDAGAHAIALSTSQELHAAAASAVGGWKALLNKLSGRK